ncbi:MAG: BTAD domain-containing putative transcriptional regulator [Clostridia bacterium]|nr:BTAD domain-containing putative transcriptional regulator [Clostridia bacterium]
MEKEQQVLQVRFMSGFSLTYGKQVMGLAKEMSSKARQLLATLLYFNRTGVPREKIIANLYQNEDADAANSFKALVFRLRRKLLQCGLPEGDYVVVKDGLYRFGDAVEVETDTDQFRAVIEAADGAESEKERAAFFAKACELYGGEFLPLSSEQPWVVFVNAELVDDYANAARWLVKYYNRRRDHEAICVLCKRVSVYFPFEEEWYIERLNALIALGRYKQALDEYEAVASMLFDEMGVYPSEQLMDCARAISNKVIFPLSSGTEVSDRLNDAPSSGAYYCSYPGFADSYHVLKRIMDRDGIPSCLLLCTVTDAKRRPLEEREHVTPAIQEISLALGRTLRKSDMYTRYSSAQMLVMLWGTGPENVNLITERLDELLAAQKMPEGVQVVYTVLAGKDAPQFILSTAMSGKKKTWRKIDGATPAI